MNETNGVTENTGGETQAAADGVTTLLGGDTAQTVELPEAQATAQTVELPAAQATAQTTVTGAPESYGAFTLPDGVDANDGTVKAAIDEASGVFKELNLTQEQAQKLVDLHMKHWMGGAVEAQERFEEEVNRRVKGWEEELQRDPEIGGARLKENLMYAKRAVGYLGGQRLAAALNETGVGSHPVIVAAFVKAGRDFFREGRFIPGSAAQARDDSPEAIAARIYPDMVKR